MARKKGKFVDKNNPSSVTFILVPSSQSNSSESYKLKRVTPQNIAKKADTLGIQKIPDTLKAKLDPSLFGLDESISRQEFEKICFDVYGDVPEEIISQFTFEETHHESAKELPVDEDTLVATDCYFPLDGYNYEQHLIDPLPTSKPRPVEPKFAPSNSEEQELVQALEDPDDYEELSDTFLELAGNVENEDEYLWGKRTRVFDDDEWSNISNDCTSEWEAQVDNFDKLIPNEPNIHHDELAYDMRVDEDEAPHSEIELGEDDMRLLRSYLNSENIASKKTQNMTDVKHSVKDTHVLDPLNPHEKKIVLNLVDNQSDDGDDSFFNHEWFSSLHKRREQWDCESILTTRQPVDPAHCPMKLYLPRREDTKLCTTVTAIADSQNCRGLLHHVHTQHNSTHQLTAVSQDESHMHSTDGKCETETIDLMTKPRLNLSTLHRPHDETPEQKRVRKAAIKAAQREARQYKKQVKAKPSVKAISTPNCRHIHLY